MGKVAQFVRGRLGSVSAGMGAEMLAVVRERLDGTVDVFVGFLPLEMPFSVEFLKLAIVLWEVSERESSTRGRAGGMAGIVLSLTYK